MKIQIKNRYTGAVIFETDAESVGCAVAAAIAAKANLRSANLRSANLYGADLRSADLRSANLRSANLCSANLYGADNWEHLLPSRTILAAGDLIGWKKLRSGVICKLRIPTEAKRVGGLIGRKCRAEFAIVLEGEGESQHEDGFIYKVGETVKPSKPFNDDPRIECASGIHFFITQEEAELYE